MTKNFAQNVISEYWLHIICEIMVKWPKKNKQTKKQFFVYNFFSEQNEANNSFKADIHMALLIILIEVSTLGHN